ncbi:MAG: NAD(+) diphosphatase [Citromicrobium sp.]|nr:NAD(+) diphosphatase [Citromicrobium sp.]
MADADPAIRPRALPIAFSGSPLDRADNLRADPEGLAARMDWKARLLLLDGLNPSVDEGGRLAWGTLADASPDAELVFLGLDRSDGGEGKACFAAVPPEGDARPRMANPQLWSIMTSLTPDQLALYGGARSPVDWHARHRFCAQCGGRTKVAKGGWQRDCDAETGCGAQHFPRTDPVSIMLIEMHRAGEPQVLLGRGLGWPEGAFSALAGFVEPGETIEEGVAREVLEEVGIRVRDVSYILSQPWPFPSQLMIGCIGHTDDDTITLDETELAEARWFTKAEIASALEGGPDAPMRSPPPHTIAHQLFRWWIAQ